MTHLTKATDQFSETAIDDEIVVMSLASGSFFSLTGTARTIWQLLDDHRTEPALLAAVAASHATDEAAIAPELTQFLSQLREAGLIVAG